MRPGENIPAILDKMVSSHLEGLHTSFPAKVVSYDSSKRKATVKPLIRLKMEAGPSISIPPIPGVPVIFPSSSGFTLDFELNANDFLLIHCTEAALGNWINSRGAETDPEDSTRFSLNDAVAVPGLYPFNAVPDFPVKIQGSSDSISLDTPTCSVVLDSDGLIAFENQAESLKGLMDDIWAELEGVTSDVNLWATGLASSPSTPTTGASFIPLVNALTLRIASITSKTLKVQQVLK